MNGWDFERRGLLANQRVSFVMSAASQVDHDERRNSSLIPVWVILVGQAAIQLQNRHKA